ncbi:heterokaryon incompatibility protein [Colletotrichum kahawae]|uniref:Heterokaryon incompatibility protein n=1 Tax=Colletotrichum kahawae TaxID=34407 RepID=A0AAD9YYD4_COLKA|nr:heterokaryon incompatibility protein [Colletotrichum kahawae]
MVIHSHLDPDRREIRLVRLRQPRTTSDLLALELRKVSLDEEGTSYNALSYVWGSSIETEQIEINGQPFCVTQNLYDALEQLEMNSVSSWLWIDAICIRQSDLVEKTHQVGMMRDIFSNAATVYMWLGLGTEETNQAMDLVSSYGPRLYASGALEMHFNIEMAWRLREFVFGRLDPSNPTGVGEGPATELAAIILDLYTEYHENFEILAPGVSDILHQSYWCRIWIIQEVALARDAVVMVGDRTVSLDAFDAAFTAMWTGGSGYLLRLSGTLYRIKALEVRGILRRGRHGPLLRRVLWETGAAPDRPHYAASDPRDLLIGLLGVLDEEEKQGLDLDYTQSFGEAFTRATRVMLESYGGPHFGLDCVKPGDFEGELPTWVPDFREIGKYGVRPYPINHGGRFFSAARENSQPERDMSVTEVFQLLIQAPETTNIETSKRWGNSVVDFVGLGPESGPGEDYVWRTAVHGYTGHFQFCWKMYIDGKMHDVPHILRKVMRNEPLGVEGLSTEGLKFLRGEGMWDDKALTSVEPVKTEETERLADRLRGRVYFDMKRNSRTLFKTRKGMFGLGHIGVAPGDVVTLVWGVGSPIVLRPRDEGGYYFRGDSYVDGIMQGEFLETQPREQELIIH